MTTLYITIYWSPGSEASWGNLHLALMQVPIWSVPSGGALNVVLEACSIAVGSHTEQMSYRFALTVLAPTPAVRNIETAETNWQRHVFLTLRHLGIITRLKQTITLQIFAIFIQLLAWESRRLVYHKVTREI